MLFKAILKSLEREKMNEKKKEKIRFVINDINSKIAELQKENEQYKIQLIQLNFKDNYLVNETEFKLLKDSEKLEVLLCKELAISYDTEETAKAFLDFLKMYKYNLENSHEITEEELIKELITDIKAIFEVFKTTELLNIKKF